MRDVRVVEDVDVALRHASLEVAHKSGHGIIEGTKMHRRGETLRQRLAAVVEDGSGEIHRVADDAGIGRAHEIECHIVGDAVEAALQDLEQERIDIAPHGITHQAPALRLMRILPSASRLAVASGGTTTVPSYSSITIGPAWGFASSPLLDITGVRSRPHCGPK